MKKTFFANLDFSSQSFQKKAVEQIVIAFRKEKDPLVILQELFRYFDFDLSDFLKKARLVKKEKEAFLGYLLYAVYYSEIVLSFYYRKEGRDLFEFFMLALLAESVGEKKTGEILKMFSKKKKVEIIAYASLYMREGCFILLSLMEKGPFLNNLRRKFYDPHLAWKLARQGLPEKRLIQLLEKKAALDIRELQKKLGLKEYSFEELASFFRMFGLYGFLKPVFIPLKEQLEEPGFVRELKQQIKTFIHHPVQYLKGLKRLVFAVPTTGIGFDKLPWLPTVVEGLEELIAYLHKKGYREIKLSDVPIIVFDQATAKIFLKNEAFIRELNKKYRALIRHISKKEAISLARDSGVHLWIKTKGQGTFGYAGSRNCVYLLAPKITGRDTLHMGEDDVAVPVCNLFLDAFYAEKYKGIFFKQHSYYIGRATSKVNMLVDHEHLISEPANLFSSTFWDPIPQKGGAGILSKPLFCLPIPFGHEEGHVKPKNLTTRAFHQPVYHFAGTRFPKNFIPESPLHGILEYLSFYLPYAFAVSMTFDLTKNIFPWNDQGCNFRSFKELYAFAMKKEVVDELKRRFWHNFEHIEKTGFYRMLVCLQYFNKRKRAPEELKHFYLAVQNDARALLTYIKDKKVPISVSKMPLTNHLLILIKAILLFGKSHRLP